ncbi:hypothetical protein ABZS66_41680 [Dactylosporangium sp. NPDC005572]|uniref:TolB family protein n=1 Tax=Dactylosporangium sp. NPDC005572 TaxID=3156889 RepID=UPI0033ACBA76
MYYEERINQAPNKLRSVRPGGKDVRDEQAGAGCEAEEFGLRALPNGRMAVSARCGYSGTTEVLDASLQAKGLRGDQRLLAPQVLYRAGADGVGHEVLRGFADIRGAALSRDGGTLVVAAKRDGDWALWRVDLPGGKVRRLADGDYGGVSIAPDRKRVAAVLGGGADDDEIRVFQL